jgi:hypothetical protein
MAQAKRAPYLAGIDDSLLAFSNSLHGGVSQVEVLQVIQATLDEFTQVIGLSATRHMREVVKTLFDKRV